ncbi:hypothetical protein BG006_003463, partial [Podila minutissima]
FLLKEELDPCNTEHKPTLPKDPAAPVIMLEVATFAWKTKSKPSDETEEDEEDEEDEANESTVLLSSCSEQTNKPTLTNVNIEIAHDRIISRK